MLCPPGLGPPTYSNPLFMNDFSPASLLPFTKGSFLLRVILHLAFAFVIGTFPNAPTFYEPSALQRDGPGARSPKTIRKGHWTPDSGLDDFEMTYGGRRMQAS